MSIKGHARVRLFPQVKVSKVPLWVSQDGKGFTTAEDEAAKDALNHAIPFRYPVISKRTDAFPESWDTDQYHKLYIRIEFSDGTHKQFDVEQTQGFIQKLELLANSKTLMTSDGVKGVKAIAARLDKVVSAFKAWAETEEGWKELQSKNPDLTAPKLNLYRKVTTKTEKYEDSEVPGTAAA